MSFQMWTNDYSIFGLNNAFLYTNFIRDIYQFFINI